VGDPPSDHPGGNEAHARDFALALVLLALPGLIVRYRCAEGAHERLIWPESIAGVHPPLG